MRYICVIVSISFCLGCQDDDVLFQIPGCGQECAIDLNGNLIIGDEARNITCNTGTAVCDYSGDGVVVTCPDFLPISNEVCDPNNIDEDCNGLGNDIIFEWFDYRNTCNGVGECKWSNQYCSETGEMVCLPISLLYGDEVCDGEDNDCDGLTDSEDPDLTYSGSDFEYSGDPDTLNIGECRAGTRRCDSGREYLFGEVLPTTEICGNNDDDDCDGLTDEDEGDALAEAFVLVIDFSGSMSGTIDAVSEALCDWSATNNFANSKFAVRAVAGTSDSAPYIFNVTEFVSAGEACDAIRDYAMTSGLSGGSEFVPYAIWGLQNDGSIDLTWPDDMTRRVIFFTDEDPQGYLDYAEDELLDVASDCGPNKYSVGGFVSNSYSLWRTMTDPCHGWLETLSYDPQDMRESLDYRFGSECGEDEEL